VATRLLEGGRWNIYEPPPAPEHGEKRREFDDIVRERPPRSREAVTSETDPTELAKTLEAITRKWKAEYDDRGIHTLHFVWGLLKWMDPGSQQEWIAPLILIPVELSRPERGETYELAPTGDDARLNPALRVKLESDFGVNLPEMDLEESTLADVRLRVEEAIGKKLPEGWNIESHAAVGMFSFAKEPMYRDLVENASLISAHPTIQSLALGKLVSAALPQVDVQVPPEDRLDDVQQPSDSFSVLDADSSQRLAIEAAIRGQSFVLMGPPGTGKSQTIANVIAELVARGKSVLFVSQKAAALDVVANRLGEADLRDLLLELHSAKASRTQVATELGRVLDSAVDIHDETFMATAKVVGASRTRLNAYAVAIHEPRTPLGMSAFTVLGELETLVFAPALPGQRLDPTRASRTDLDRVEASVSRLADAWDPIDRADEFQWHDSAISSFTAVERQRVSDTLAAAISARGQLSEVEQRLAGELERDEPTSRLAREALLRIGDLVTNPKAPPVEWLTSDDLRSLSGLIEKWSRVTVERGELANHLTGAFGKDWPNLSAQASDDLEGLLPDMARLLESEIVGRTVRELERAAAAARDASAEIKRTSQLVERLRQSTGVRSRGDGLDDVQLLLEVARITQQRDRPPAQWLARARAEDAEQFLETWGSEYERAQLLRSQLLEQYDDELLAQDPVPILARMERYHGKWWSVLRPSHRSDRRLLTRLHRTRQLSPTVLDDLRQFSDLVSREHTLVQLDASEKAVLGPYGRGLSTEIPRARQALRAAWRLIGLPHDATDWGKLSGVAAHETAFDPVVDRTADELVESLRVARLHLEPVTSIAGDRWVIHRSSSSKAELIESLDRISRGLDAVAHLARQAERVRSAPLDNIEQFVAEAALRRSIHDADEDISRSDAELRASLHGVWRGLDTDWEIARDALIWSTALRREYEGGISLTLADRIVSGAGTSLPVAAYAASVEALGVSGSAVEGLFDESRRGTVETELYGPRAAALELLATLQSSIDQLSTWVRFKGEAEELERSGWLEFVQAAIARKSIRADLAPAVRRAWLSAWLEGVIAGDPRLSDFRREEHERLVSSHSAADQRLIRGARERVLRRYEDQKPASVTLERGEQALIRREATKRRRHIPVRLLLGSMPVMLPRLKPCLMMSPLSVSHFLTPTVTFDVVVFDEASQVPPEDAINCIYRGKQLIVAGDPNQLPPTDFFQLAAVSETDAELESQVDDFESVLDLARASNYPVRPLRWHYRSRHDSLIAFSNVFIYNNSLVTFPPAYRDGDELGVKFVHVSDGVFDRGRSAKNLVEARRVVEELVNQLRAEPDLSVGIVAFSVAQQEAIQDEWERILRDNPDLDRFTTGDRLHNLFIKNLETVQGDERDVIIFSIGYGRDSAGRFLMNFGPLNRNGGWRRLNVAVTRARNKVIVVSSITADDFRLAETVVLPGQAQRGPDLLRAYLEYAQRGVLPRPELGAAGRGDAESGFETEVAKAIRELGYDVVPQVGVSTYRIDIGVVSRARPSRFALGLECDGASYHSAKTARDRDRLREQVLRGLGWRIHRVWSQDWYERRALAIDRIRIAIEAAEVEEVSLAVPRPAGKMIPAPIALGHEDKAESIPSVELEDEPRIRRPRDSIDFTDSLDTSRLPWVMAYAPVAVPRYRATYLDFHEPGLKSDHATRITNLVMQEGPMHIDVIAARLSRAFGLQRVGARMAAAVYEAIRAAEHEGGVRRKGPFVWPATIKELGTVRVPQPGVVESERTVDEIPPEEIDLAVMRVVETAVQLTDSDLRVAVARVFGFNRTGDLIGAMIGNRLEHLAAAGKIAVEGEGWRLMVDLPKVAPRKNRNQSNEFSVGEWVRHPKLGVGRVVLVKRGLITIRYGRTDKQFDPQAVNLERTAAPRR
jgi:very-short-patch-repair endonuclease